MKDGKTSVLNGPYAEVKEQLGGYYLIEAPDLDGAIAWAARRPGAGWGDRGAADLGNVTGSLRPGRKAGRRETPRRSYADRSRAVATVFASENRNPCAIMLFAGAFTARRFLLLWPSPAPTWAIGDGIGGGDRPLIGVNSAEKAGFCRRDGEEISNSVW